MKEKEIIMNKIFEEYTLQVIDTLKIRFPNLKESAIRKMIEKDIEKNFVEKEAILFNSFTNVKSPVPLSKVASKIITEGLKQPIITGNATLYRNQNEAATLGSENLAAEMIDFFLKERKVAKNKMLQYENSNPDLSKKYNVTQSLIKVIVNSYFGVFGENRSQFYDVNTPESITYTGAIVSTTSIVSFEMLFGNNIFLKEVEDVYEYIRMSLKSKSSSKIEEMLDRSLDSISHKKVAKYLSKMVIEKNEFTYEKILDFISELSYEDLNIIYYKNNLLKFIENSNEMSKQFRLLFTKELTEEKEKSVMIKILEYLNQYIFLTEFFIPERMEIVETCKRKAIIVCDTDSNFLYLDPIYKFLINRYELEDNNETLLKVLNKLIEISQKYISMVFNNLARNMNVLSEYRSRIEMKSEFIFSKVMLTKNKRNYATRIICKEGHLLDKPKIEIKGLPIKKISTIKKVRTHFQKILKYILECKELDLSEVLKGFITLSEEIFTNLRNGNCDFLIPSKVNDVSNYKKPLTIRSYKGTLFWNELYPFEVIHPPEKVNLLYLTKDPKLVAQMMKEPEMEVIVKFLKVNPELSKYGFEYLALPLSCEKLPSWIIPYIDYNSMALSHIANGIILLDSCNIKTIKLNKGGKKTFTNCINL